MRENQLILELASNIKHAITTKQQMLQTLPKILFQSCLPKIMASASKQEYLFIRWREPATTSGLHLVEVATRSINQDPAVFSNNPTPVPSRAAKPYIPPCFSLHAA